MMNQPLIIVGAGHAGGRAALTLREEGYAGRLILIGDEPHLPYERPPLSKGLLQGSIACNWPMASGWAMPVCCWPPAAERGAYRRSRRMCCTCAPTMKPWR